MKAFERELRIGDEGPDVYELQCRLVDIGFNKCKFDDGSIGEIEPNGIFGAVTEKCLKRFQEKCYEAISKIKIYDLNNANPAEFGIYNAQTYYILRDFESLKEYFRVEILPDDIAEEEPEQEEPESETAVLVTREKLKAIFRVKDAVIDKHFEALNKTLNDYAINTPLRIQHFLAQIGHESCGLKFMEEIASGAAYEGRGDLGNIYEGDGRRYKGRTPLMITGRANYTAYFESIGRTDLIETPEILTKDMVLMWGATAWYWKTRKLNKWADKDDILQLTRRINGGYNGLADRKAYLARAKRVIV